MSQGKPEIDLIVGLGNPGAKYARTRHNAGFWFVDELARRCSVSLRSEKKFRGDTARAQLCGRSIQLLKPDTFMNLSGEAVQAIASFYKWQPDNILVVHDEIDLPPGVVRLKRGGGHGGNNGLRDITQKIGKDFLRLRIGVGRPTRGEVIDHVLGRPSADDQTDIERAMEDGHRAVEVLIQKGLEKAMHQLHTKAAACGDSAAAPGKTNGTRSATAPKSDSGDTSDEKTLRGQLADWFNRKG